MLAFGVCIGSQERFDRVCRAGLTAVAEPDSPIITTTHETSIFAAYNEILDAAATIEGLEALVLLHDDVEITDPAFPAKVRAALAAQPDVGVVGVIGASGVTNLRWWDAPHRFGRVAETRGEIAFRPAPATVDSVDGLCMILAPEVVREIRFDTETYTGFHGYDIDYCFEVRRSGRRVVVADIAVSHHAVGGYKDEAAFDRAEARWTAKWTPALVTAEVATAEAAATATAPPPAPTPAPSRDEAVAAGVHRNPQAHDARYYDYPRDELTRHLPATARRVLDVGCGSGGLGASVIAKYGAEVVGIEFVAEAAARAAERLNTVIRMDLNTVTELPFPDGHFDAMFFGDVLEHLLDPAATLGVLSRYLAADGVIIASIPNVRHWSVLAPLLGTDAWTYTDAGLLDRTHVHFFTLNEAAAMFQGAGFTVFDHIESIVVPDGVDIGPLVRCAVAYGADEADAAMRLRAYQYVMVMRRAVTTPPSIDPRT
ncbi:MAG: methyltransferase domain-containing protein [Thermoleophilia bacterium]|nr:methyltransferase domain-containing protein [Thermoleophilia bacterium]